MVGGIFAGSPIGALCGQLLFLLLAGAPSGEFSAPTRLSLLVFAGLSLLFGASAFCLYVNGRILSLRRLHGIRQLASMIDELRNDIIQKRTEEAVIERLKRFIGEALGVIDRALFPSKSVEMTFMRRVTRNRLKVVAVYPFDKNSDPSFYLDVDGSQGYARLAFFLGRTVYLPSVQRNWGAEMMLARRPGDLPRLRAIHKDLWKESTRIDYGSLICAPAMTVKNVADFKFDSYGVLNLEDVRRRVVKNAFGAHDLYCACLAAGVLGNAIEASTTQLNTLPGA